MAQDLRLQLVLETLNRASAPLRQITNDSTRTGQALRASRVAMRGLQRQQDDISSFQRLRRATNESATQLSEARRTVERLQQQLQTTAAPTARLRREFEQARTAATRLETSHAGNRRQLMAVRSSLVRAGVSTSNLSSEQTRLAAQVAQTNTAIQQQQARLSRLAAQQRRNNQLTEMSNRGAMQAAKGVAAMYAGQRALGGMMGLMDEGFDFDAAMSRVQALTGLEKESSKMLALRAQARELGATTSFTAGEAAGGQGFLAMAGFTPDAIKAAMPGILSLAKAAGAELAETANIGSNILSGFGLDASEMGRVGDVLTAAFTSTNTDLQMLGQTMVYAAPIASKLGGSIEEVSAMAGKLGKEGIKAGMAGTALRSIYGRLAAPPKAAADALAQLNVQTTDAKGNLLPMVQILEDLSKQTRSLGDAEKAGLFKDIAGEEAFGALGVLADGAATGEIQKLVADIKSAQGAAGRTAGVMADNARGDIKALGSAWADVQIGLQSAENGPIRALIQDVTRLIRSVGKWTQANPELTATIVKFVAIAAVAAVVMGTIGVAAGGAMMGFAALARAGSVLLSGFRLLSAGAGLLARVLPVVLTAVRAIVMFLMANPIGLIIGGIATAAYLIYDNWAPISEFFRSIWAQISTAFSGGLSGVLTLLANWSPLGILYSVMQQALASLGVELPGKFSEFGSNLISGLISGITSKITALKSSITGVASDASNWFKDKLGINSPSRVFTSHGSDVMAGLEKGLGDNKKTLAPVLDISKRLAKSGEQMALPNVSKPLTAAGEKISAPAAGMASRFDLSKKLKQATAGVALTAVAMNAPALDNRPPLQAKAQQQSGSFSIGEIHIHAAPGMDEQALARMVAAEIQRLHTSKMASTRSNLTDED